MANPVYISLQPNMWTKIATNVTQGVIYNMSNNSTILQTYRMTGDPAPTTANEGAVCFSNNTFAVIESAAGIDVYLYPVQHSASVRVDV